jgi:geranylgeranyl diphosphate synthase, type II
MTLTLQTDEAVDALTAVDARLSGFFADAGGLVSRHGPQFLRLWAEIEESTVGGKRFRPTLVIDTHRALGGDAMDEAVATGTAVELLHTSFLLHDDVIDGDTVRRGRPNLIGALADDARRDGLEHDEALAWSRSAAILAGDLLLHSAQAMIARLDLDMYRRNRLLDLFEESVFVTAAGELLDVAFSRGVSEPTAAEVLAMTGWKTAHYSFEAPLAAGAILAGASDATIATLTRYGRLLGLAFQLRDDLLGVFGSEGLTGKSTVSDLRGTKMTALAAFARDSPFGAEFRAAIAERDSAQALARARSVLVSCGGQTYVEELIDAHVRSAIDVIDAGGLPDELHEYLVDVADRATRRSS